MRTCQLRGRLAGADWPMPTEASVVDHLADPVSVPCSRMRCRRCGAGVRHGDRLSAREDARGRAAELYGATEWAGLDWLAHDRPARLYACRCTLFREVLHRSIDEERDSLDSLVPDWECAGHPDPTLPLTLDGVEVRERSDGRALTERALAGVAPPSDLAALRVMPSMWLRRLAAQTEGTGVDEAVAEALVEALRRPEHRGAALHFFQYFPRSLQAEAVVREVAGAPEQVFVAVKLPGAGAWVAASVGDVLLERCKGGSGEALDAAAIGALREGASRPGAALPEGLFDWFVTHDAEQFARAAPAVERARPGSWKALLRAFEEAGRDELVLAAAIGMLGAGVVPAAELRTWASAGHRQRTGFAMPLTRATQ